MNAFAQIILSEPTILFMASMLVTGTGWTLKKVIDIDARLRGIEERCRLHQNHPGGMMMPALLLSILVPIMVGCTSTTVDYGGATFKRSSWGSKVAIGELSVTTTNGTVLTLKSYNNDSVEALGVVSERVATGVAKGLKP
jgi:hypothetical protein